MVSKAKLNVRIMYRNYKSSEVKQACDGVDMAIVCLGTGSSAVVQTISINNIV